MLAKKALYEGGKLWVKEKIQKNFLKSDMPMMIVIGTTTIISTIRPFQPDLGPKFFYIESIQEFDKYAYTSLAIIVVGVHGETKVQVGDKPRDLEQLMVANKPNFYNQDVISIGTHLKEEYEHIVKTYQSGQYTMILMKNVSIKKYSYRHMHANNFTLLTKVVEEVVCARLINLHNKFTKNQPSVKEV